ncbi:hypothetical protein B0H19DRAFT_1239717 [Mycena capillaripes]|nr:hypothetical protein B0H19DRAFT_1239717 [Mycena capillaripes]
MILRLRYLEFTQTIAHSSLACEFHRVCRSRFHVEQHEFRPYDRIPPTLAKQWTEKINHIPDAHKPSTPLDAKPPPIPKTSSGEAGKMQARAGAERTMFPASQMKVDPRAAAYLASFDSYSDKVRPPRPPFAADDIGSAQSGLSNLSTEAQAGSLRHLGASDSSTHGTTTQSAENLGTIMHTGTPGSPHPVAPLSRLVDSSEKTGIPPTSFSATVDSNQNKAQVAPLAGSNLQADDGLDDTPPADTSKDAAPDPTSFPERPKRLPVVGKARE